MELTLVVIALLVAGAVLTRRAGAIDRRTWCLVGACGAIVFLDLGMRDRGPDEVLQAALPDAVTDGGFVTSATCKSCHPGEYHSWHHSYHRTMTQPASPETVIGDFDDVSLSDRGLACKLERRGDEFWIEMDDPAWWSSPAEKRVPTPHRGWFRIVMTTGSHHLQAYWVRRSKSEFSDGSAKNDGLLMQIPWVWLAEEQRWAPNQDSFLTPELSAPQTLLPWITSCNMCHSVGTQPHLGTKSDASATVELGIACEACHGPGEAHVRANLSPLRRYGMHLRGAADPTIINPARLSKERSAEVCGQCHSFNKELDMKRSGETGVAYRAGDVLGETKAVFGYTENPTHPRLLLHLKAEPNALEGRFWKDGTIRTAGREFNGLLKSKCYTHGEMTCLSCHAMHDYSERKDMLSPKALGDQSCLQCHADIGTDVQAHTNHAPTSSGSRCMNCHMPHTTFGLFVAMRSHRIDNPSAAVTAKTGRPNACNLCHLDRTLAWTAEKLTDWYGHDPVKMSDDEKKIASSVLMAVSGNGPQRAIMAWAMGWKPAQEASGRQWLPPYLSGLMSDSYAVTRQVAYRSLRTLPDYADFKFDFVSTKSTQQVKADEVLQRWLRGASKNLVRNRPHLLLSADGKLNIAEHTRLLKARDNTPVSIIE
jgi:hypothetical protein